MPKKPRVDVLLNTPNLFIFATMKHIFTLTFLLLILTVNAAIPAGWNNLLTCRKQEGNIKFKTPWGAKSRPVVFIIRQKDTERSIRISISADGWEVNELNDDGRYTELPPIRVYPKNKVDGETADITFKVREDEWSYYVDDELRGSMAAPFALPGSILWPKRPGVKLIGNMRFLPVPHASFKTDFMIEPGAPNELYPWAIKLGNWHLHTAQQQAVIRPETNQQRAKEAPLTADKSPNFYSLKGGGNNQDSIIATGYDFYDNYSLTGSLQLEEGEAGIVFLHQDPSPVQNDAGEQIIDQTKANYYAFTIRMETPFKGNRDVRLWKQQNGTRTVLARASIPLFHNQWYLPGIKVHGDEIICYMDEAELFRVKDQLPSGGKIGLFANTPAEIRFDDITLNPYTTFDLTDMQGIRHNAIYHTGGFFSTPKKISHQESQQGFRIFKTPEVPVLKASSASKDELLVLGRAHNKGLMLSAKVSECKGAFGMIAGWTSPSESYFRFQASLSEADKSVLSCALLKILPDGKTEELDKYDVKLSGDDIALMIDSTDSGKIRCYANELLIHFHEQKEPVSGANGLWLAPESSASFTNLQLSGTHERTFEQEQKNPVFKTDSFMRHWAAPEGQWISGGKDILWHKGDFFGDFTIRLPIVPNGELHVAVPEGKDTGSVIIKMTADKITLSTKLASQEAPAIQEAPLAAKGDKKVEGQIFELVHEGSWLWVKVEGETVIKQRLDTALKTFGTRVLSRGMNLAHMSKSKVTRVNVLDEYFNESPHAWLTNGGDWQIINRFQCTPSWSHMIAEALNGLGAFWLKKHFKGDMTIEFYAGTRHEHYDEAGNLNCTIMADATTPSSGYTVGCTEWDQNLSQNWTTLYRDGKALAKTDAYLVPRRRKGMYRKILNPLIAEGRPYHGAWFYIKLRKIGNMIEYYFDDERIFAKTDDNPLMEGGVGIWTFVHSMTLAQIKVTFDEMSPKPIPVTFLPTEDKAPQPQEEIKWNGTVNEFPLDAMAKRFWSYNDLVNQGDFTQFDNGFILKSTLGGGEMKVVSSLPQIKTENLAGIRFDVKRTSKAKFNFYFHLQEKNDKGEYHTVRNLFHRISGDEFSDGNWRMHGATDVPAIQTVDSSDANWTTATVWFNARPRKLPPFLKIGGFGIEQLDAISNGITGNGPGETYAIRNLHPIFFCKPALAETGDTIASDPTEDNGVFTVPITLANSGKNITRQFSWVENKEKPQYSIDWTQERYDSFIFRQLLPVPDSRLSQNLSISFNDKQIRTRHESDGSAVFSLPRTEEAAKAIASGKVEFKVKYGDSQDTVSVQVASKSRLNQGPVLQEITGLSPFLKAMENESSHSLESNDGRLRIQGPDKRQGKYLRIQNRGQQQLKTPSFSAFSLAQFPVAQFRYRAWDMDYVSMIFSNGHYARLTSSDSGRPVAVRLGKDLTFDETWRTWTGIVTDAFTSENYASAKFIPNTFHISSIGSPDQTGRYSKIDLDDLVFGPAVSSQQQLECTPSYYDFDGVASVSIAILADSTPAYDTPEEKLQALKWTSFKPGEKVTPQLPEGIADGIHHLLFQAADTAGNKSAIFDVPFMLDRKKLTITSQVVDNSTHEMNGKALVVDLNNSSLSPWDISKATYSINGKNVKIHGWTNQFIHSQGKDRIVLNHPLIFKKELDNAKDGDTLALDIDNIIDGAGNTVPKYTASFKVDYASDKRGPAWHSLGYSSAVLFAHNWDGTQSGTRRLGIGRHNDYGIAKNANASPFLVHYSYYSTADLLLDVKWHVASHPCISFRLSTSTLRNNMTIRLILTTANATYQIAMRNPGTESNELNKTDKFTWENNKWINFTFNVADMLKKAGLSDDVISNMVITNFNIQRRGLEHRDNILVDDFYIHGMPESGKKDLLTWSSFDVSGTASLEATALSADGKDEWTHSFTDQANTDLNVLREKFEGTKWFRMQAKDKAGNLSIPFFMPIYSKK